MLNKVLVVNMKLNKSICERFDKIVATVTKPAETPDDCVELIKFVEYTKIVETYQLKVRHLRIELKMI